MKKIMTLTTALAIGIALAYSCVLSFDVNPDDINLTMNFKKDASCNSIVNYTVIGKKPYDKSFTAVFTGAETVIQHWVGMPDGEIPIQVRLGTGLLPTDPAFAYDLSIDKEWSPTKEGTFNAFCDANNPKPVLTFDMYKIVAIFTNKPECHWFKAVEFFEESPSVDPDAPPGCRSMITGEASSNPAEQGLCRKLYAGDWREDRMIYFWRAPADASKPSVIVKLTDVQNKTYFFPFPSVDISVDSKLYFNVSCESCSDCVPPTQSVSMELQLGSLIIPPGYPSDGDVEEDGDADISETEEPIDGDADSDKDTPSETDQPGETDSTTEEAETDSGEGDNPDVETGDQEAEGESGCGTVMPESPVDILAAASFQSDKSSADAKVVHFLGEGDADLEESESDAGDTDPADAEAAEADPDPETEADNIQDFYAKLDTADNSQFMVFKIPVAKPFTYRIWAYYVGGSDWNQVQLFYEDQGTPLVFQDGTDTYDLSLRCQCAEAECLCPDSAKYQPICLTKGDHYLKVKPADCVGKCKVGAYNFKLVPVQ